MNQVAIVALPLTLYLRFAYACTFTLKEDELRNLIDIAIAYETSNETMYWRCTYSFTYVGLIITISSRRKIVNPQS